jgi:hypothetical protein
VRCAAPRQIAQSRPGQLCTAHKTYLFERPPSEAHEKALKGEIRGHDRAARPLNPRPQAVHVGQKKQIYGFINMRQSKSDPHGLASRAHARTRCNPPLEAGAERGDLWL